MAVYLTMLGGLDARRDADELQRLLGQRARAALLVYLVAERRVSRETLLTVFWPESSSENARHALRQSLYHLRGELGSDWLAAGAHELRIGADVQADVHEFDAAIEGGLPEAAARLYGGPFLHGVNLVDLQPWEQWVDGKRAHYARRFRRACRDWADARIAVGDVAGAVEAARCWVAPDPLDEEAQHRLVTALANSGERSEAIRELERFERLLLAEGLEPSAETATLARRIRAGGSGWSGVIPQAARTPLEVPPEVPTVAEQPSVPAPRAMRWRALGAAAVLVLALTAAMAVQLRRDGSPAVLSPTDLAVLPFTIRGGEDARFLREGMVTLLTASLDGASVRPVDTRAVLAVTAADGGRAPGVDRGRRLATHLGAGLFILGDVVQAGEQLQIEAAVYRTDAGRQPVGSAAVSGGSERLFELVDSLSARLLVILGGPAGDRLTTTAATTTGSLAAFKAFLEGEADMRAGRFERASDAYQRALAHDTTFAVAHYRLALARDWGALAGTDEPARAAARHAARLAPRDRALVEALQVYQAGQAAEAERRYRVILARYPDDLEARLQLAEVLFHFGPVLGRRLRETEDALRLALTYEPRNVPALVHLARLAAADGRVATLDSLVSEFSSHERATDRRLVQIDMLRASGTGDSVAIRRLARGARDWEDAAVYQLAAYVTAFTAEPAVARLAVSELMATRRSADVEAEMHWLTGLLHLAGGQVAAAQRSFARTGALNASAGSTLDRYLSEQVTTWWMSTLPIPYADSTLVRVRDAARSPRNAPAGGSTLQTGGTALTEGSPALGTAFFAEAFGAPARLDALRHATVGALSLRLGDPAGARTASSALERLAASPRSDAMVRGHARVLRARITWHDGNPAEALRILDSVELGPTSVSAVNVIPFVAQADVRYLRGELLVALGRDADALRWFESLGSLSVPESALRAPAHLRQAEIQERLGNRDQAAMHYERFVALWDGADPELEPMVLAARGRLEALRGR